MPNKIYAVLDKDTQEFCTYNGRCAWTKEGNAKNAWYAGQGWSSLEKFDEQDNYEIVELTEVYHRLQGLMK